MTQTKTNTNEKETKMTTSLKRIARIAGVLYLLVAIFGGFALGFVYPKIYVAGDAAKTAGNLLANSGLVRLGVVADLFQATVWVFVAITLYLLLKHVNKSVASAMVVLAAIGASITCLNTVFEFEALRVATGAVNLATFGAAGSNALVLLVVGCVCYLVDMLAAFLVPDFGQNIHTFVTIPSAIAEIWMVGYLLVIGVKAQKPEKRILAAVAMPGAEA